MNDSHQRNGIPPEAGPAACERPDRRTALEKLGKLAYATPALITLGFVRSGHSAISGTPPPPPGDRLGPPR